MKVNHIHIVKNFVTSIMKRTKTTRASKILKQEQEEHQSEIKSNPKVDLSAFKKVPKSKLTNNIKVEGVGEKSKQSQIQCKEEEIFKQDPEKELSPTKRQHVKIEYDEVGNGSDVKKNKRMPENWEQVLANLKEMRKHSDAPVDSMGCDKCHDENAPPNVMRYQQLLALMLSSQTKDQITHSAMKKLIDHGCTVENILGTADEKLGELIYPVSFWRNKVKYIKKTSDILQKEYDCDIPDTVEKLCKLPGVGPKMAHICMETAWDKVTGIGVDTHVHRISNRLRWVNTNNPEDTRKALEDWLPQELWSEVNLLLVGFGQQICGAVKPQCSACLNKELCPFGKKYLKGEAKTKKTKSKK
ncbi:unnamed protein product [Diabrotica balteata]|uniref:Endonuclease III homolog n=1 Tax=Diabrotica balteata TaxID=107213 RepID=A0A9N9XK48_DIABA|nr:unnamed protein product [Diabrotica balteata]